MSIFTKDHLREDIEKFGWEVGEHTYGLPRIINHPNSGRLKIGRYCSIAGNVSIFLGGDHRPDWVTTYPFTALTQVWPTGVGIKGHPTSKGDVVVGNDVWIGAGATIMSGVTIGHGAVIGNGASIMTDVPEYGIAIGNPARTFKKRFSDDIIARLMAVQWWDWPDAKVKEAVPLLCSADITMFLEAYGA